MRSDSYLKGDCHFCPSVAVGAGTCLPYEDRLALKDLFGVSLVCVMNLLTQAVSSMVIVSILTAGASGRSGSRGGMDISTSMPSTTSPKTECFPARCGVGMCVIKHFEPL